MATFASGNIRLGANTAQLDDKLKRSSRNVSRFSKAGQRDIQSFNRVATRLVGIFTAFAGLQAFRTVLRDIDALTKQSRALNVPLAELQRTIFSLSEQGIDESRTVRSFGKIANAVSEANEGLASYLDDFEALGISQADLADGNVIRIQREVFKALGDVEDVSKRAAIAQRLLGRSFAEVRIDIEAFDAAQADYITNTDAAGNSIEVFNDNVAKISTNLRTLFTTAVVESVNSFGTSLEDVNRYLIDNQKQIRDSIRGVFDFVRGMSDLIKVVIALVAIKIGRGAIFWLASGITTTIGNVLALTRNIYGLTAAMNALAVASAVSGGGGLIGLLRTGRFAGLAALTKTLGVFRLIGVVSLKVAGYVAVIGAALLAAGVAVTAILAPLVIAGQRFAEWLGTLTLVRNFLDIIDGAINSAVNALSRLTGVVISDFQSFAQAAIIGYFNLIQEAVRVTSVAFANILNFVIGIYQIFEDIGFAAQEGFIRLAGVVIEAYNAIARVTGLFAESAFDADQALQNLANTARVFEKVDANKFGEDVVAGLDLENLGQNIAEGLVGPLQERVNEVGEQLTSLSSANTSGFARNQGGTGVGNNALTEGDNNLQSNVDEESSQLAGDFLSSFSNSARMLLRGGGLDDVGQSFLDSFTASITDNAADAFSMLATSGIGALFGGFNRGGFVGSANPTGANRDTVPALLTIGEYVLSRDDVSAIEAGAGRSGGDSFTYAPQITGEIGPQTRRIIRQEGDFYNANTQRAIQRGVIRR